jgi:cell division septum initiation protein DivIVA
MKYTKATLQTVKRYYSDVVGDLVDDLYEALDDVERLEREVADLEKENADLERQLKNAA